jgi:hypothetical protein
MQGFTGYLSAIKANRRMCVSVKNGSIAAGERDLQHTKVMLPLIVKLDGHI